MEESANSGKKADRQRKKKYYNEIRQQIEFYLGDVNLSKDRFFNGLLRESPYVDIDVILNCNKIKKLTTKASDIVKALNNSAILSVTDDKNKIYRTVPLKPITNEDECTIYVEDLPPEADHEWLKSVFKAYGYVVYVSVPKYKQSSKIKGFAFVQFDSPESAEKALKAFQSANSCLSSNIAPTELCSVKTFEGEKDVVVIEHNKTDIEHIKVIANKHESTSEKEMEDGEPQKKKRKRDRNMETVQASDSIDNISGCDLENNFEEKNVRKRKRKKSKKNEHVQTYGMQILSKQEWKKLRNKYLEEQRKKMHELKEQLRKARLNREEEEENETIKTTEGEEENGEEKVTPLEEGRVKFTPGVIVKQNLDQPITNIKNFKSEVKRYANVEYIDVTENSLAAYFRCSSNEIANQVIALNKWPNMEILKGEEELAYWEKIKLDRKKKVNEKIRCKTRGKTKLIKKVEAAVVKHIKFPD